MGLMPIIFTALSIFVVTSFVFLTISYLLYKLKQQHKPNTIKPNLSPANKPLYYSIPVQEMPIKNSYRKPENIHYNKRVNTSDSNRFEILNQQKPKYAAYSENSDLSFRYEGRKNIFDYYSDEIDTLKPVSF